MSSYHCSALINSFYDQYTLLKPSNSLEINQQIKKVDPNYIFICKQGKLTIVQQNSTDSNNSIYNYDRDS